MDTGVKHFYSLWLITITAELSRSPKSHGGGGGEGRGKGEGGYAVHSEFPDCFENIFFLHLSIHFFSFQEIMRMRKRNKWMSDLLFA